MKIYDIILDGDCGVSAIDYAMGIDFSEIEEVEYNSPSTDYRYTSTVDGIDIYYNFVGDYYMFANEERK